MTITTINISCPDKWIGDLTPEEAKEVRINLRYHLKTRYQAALINVEPNNTIYKVSVSTDGKISGEEGEARREIHNFWEHYDHCIKQ